MQSSELIIVSICSFIVGMLIVGFYIIRRAKKEAAQEANDAEERVKKIISEERKALEFYKREIEEKDLIAKAQESLKKERNLNDFKK